MSVLTAAAPSSVKSPSRSSKSSKSTKTEHVRQHSKHHQAIAPAPVGLTTEDYCSSAAFGGDFTPGTTNHTNDGGKKQLKRAANRKSAQLSRKRKKQLMEFLKDENDDLRRKEQILKSIPDLVVVFDSTGKLWFVSESVSTFVHYAAHELEGTSIWDLLCGDSVRLLKAAFMDSLAARRDGSETAPLGNGFWELRLVDRDGNHKIVTLNGVVHFAGERPECVCSIRPSEDNHAADGNAQKTEAADTAQKSSYYRSLIRVKPSQSVVVSNESSDGSSSDHQQQQQLKTKTAMRSISDSGNSGSSSGASCGESEEIASGEE
jgi:PAS domain S-box-containing protein